MLRRSLRFALFAAVVSAAPMARGQAPASADETRALELFTKSEEAYQRGQFRDAAKLLREAFTLKNEPVLLYNLARAYEGAGDLEQAAKAYEDFLAMQPETKDRGAIEQRITTLRRQIADAKKRVAPPPPPPPPTPERRPSPIPWVIAGVGVAGIGAGAVLGVISQKRHRDARDEPVQTKSESDQSDAKSLATASSVAFIAGGVVTAVGVVWGLLDVNASTPKRVALAPWLGGATFTVRFE